MGSENISQRLMALSQWMRVVVQPALWPTLVRTLLLRPLRTRLRYCLHGAYDLSYYPANIHHLALAAVEEGSSSLAIPQADWPLHVASKSETIEGFVPCLAGRTLSMESLRVLWKDEGAASHLDPEVEQAVHRFHWLLVQAAQRVDQDNIKQSLSLVNTWLDCHPSPDNGVAWQPYTTSERICNWVVYWSVITHHQGIDNDLAVRWSDAIRLHLRYLASQLEYPASVLVNNHLLNNARALYIGGRFIADTTVVELGKALFKSHLSKMIGDGYLLEGSSHYQLLLTRSVEEVVRVARWSEDESFACWMEEFSKRMREATLRLFPPGLSCLSDLSRIGDVSPDVPFDWFDPRPSADENGWQRVWGVMPKTEVETVTGVMDGWAVAVNGSWYALAYSHPATDGYPQGHGHEDFGSACVYCNGMPVLVDIGRFSYALPTVTNFHGDENMCHNIVTIDTMPILSAGRGFLAVISAEARCKAHFYLDDQCRQMIWRATAISGVQWCRKLRLDAVEGLRLDDEFVYDGRDSHTVEGYYYFSPDVQLELECERQWKLGRDGITLQMRIEGVDTVICEETNFYPHYGVQSKTRRLRWQCSVQKKTSVSLIINQ